VKADEERDELYMESVRRFNERRCEQHRLAWSTRFETDYGLRWDHERGVWADSEGHAYDGERLYGYSRSGGRPDAA